MSELLGADHGRYASVVRIANRDSAYFGHRGTVVRVTRPNVVVRLASGARLAFGRHELDDITPRVTLGKW